MDGRVEVLLAQLHDVVDSLVATDLDTLSDSDLLDVVRDAEASVRRFAPMEHELTAEVERRGLARARGCANTATLLAQLLRFSSSEAKARVTAAQRCASRRAVSGEPLEPMLPAVAAAQAEGAISARLAAMIGDTVDRLPAAVDESGGIAGIETFLVEQARQFTPETLAKISRRLVETIDPDGVLRDASYRDRRRRFTLHRRADGSVSGTFEGTAEFGEVLQTVLDVTAAPEPAADGTRDQRSADQRRHDGLLDALRLVLRAKELPTANGVSATVVLTMSVEQWQTERGLAGTGHGALVGIVEAKRIAGGDARLLPVVLSEAGADPPTTWPFRSAKPVAGYGTCHRIFTENQRLAMAARDGGCTFPGCTVPVLWCEADHVVPFGLDGPTSIDNGHLVCPHHHREKDRYGWLIQMMDDIPHWVAPAWLDPHRTPQRNHAHSGLGVG